MVYNELPYMVTCMYRHTFVSCRVLEHLTAILSAKDRMPKRFNDHRTRFLRGLWPYCDWSLDVCASVRERAETREIDGCSKTHCMCGAPQKTWRSLFLGQLSTCTYFSHTKQELSRDRTIRTHSQRERRTQTQSKRANAHTKRAPCPAATWAIEHRGVRRVTHHTWPIGRRTHREASRHG